jgi:hypothetical protein
MYGIGAAAAPMRATFAKATTMMAGIIASASAAVFEQLVIFFTTDRRNVRTGIQQNSDLLRDVPPKPFFLDGGERPVCSHRAPESHLARLTRAWPRVLATRHSSPAHIYETCRIVQKSKGSPRASAGRAYARYIQQYRSSSDSLASFRTGRVSLGKRLAARYHDSATLVIHNITESVRVDASILRATNRFCARESLEIVATRACDRSARVEAEGTTQLPQSAYPEPSGRARTFLGPREGKPPSKSSVMRPDAWRASTRESCTIALRAWAQTPDSSDDHACGPTAVVRRRGRTGVVIQSGAIRRTRWQLASQAPACLSP